MRILPISLPTGIAILSCWGASVSANPSFVELLNNPHWYRTYDSASSIIPAEGKLLFAWDFTDPDHKVDSFYVGIDTLWGLPQDVTGDTAADWDLQVCPDEICMNGLKDGIHGANSPYPFGGEKTRAEHHFQFFPAISRTFDFMAPPRSLFGALMYCRSRSTGKADTVLAFGAWKLAWDSASAPPVRPVDGYLPRLSDFVISGDTVRYVKGAAGIAKRKNPADAKPGHLHVTTEAQGLRIGFPGLQGPKEVAIYGWDGKRIWSSGTLGSDPAELIWNRNRSSVSDRNPGFYLVRLSWPGGQELQKASLLAP